MEKMSQQNDYRILIRTAPAGTFTLTNVFSSPRQCTPVDVKAACASVELVEQSGDMPRQLAALASFMTLDFFALAHRTGLYNRQRNLWESIGRVVEIRCARPNRGLFTKVNEPFTDVSCLDARGNVLIFGSLADADDAHADADANLKLKRHFVSKALQRASGIRRGQGFLFGVFLAFQDEIPEAVQVMIDGMTAAHDPVARYESMLPPPLNAPLNIAKLDACGVAGEQMKLTLVHPSLRSDESPRNLAEAG
jgi:hypothetical protein